MSINKVTVSFATVVVAAVLMSALPAFAQSTTTKGVATSSKSTARLTAIITKADTDITARIDALNTLNSRIQGLRNVSADEKVSIASGVQTNIDGLTALKTKIDADTDLPTTKADAQSIFTTFRIYALIVPQGWIMAAADRVTTTAGLMTKMGENIQTRISADQTAGKDVSALTSALADMTAKVTDATTRSATAQAAVSALVPDKGDKTVAASNHTALVGARSNIKTATMDLQVARKDITSLLQGLKTLDGNVAASSTSGQ